METKPDHQSLKNQLQFIRVSARVRPFLQRERGERRVLEVVRKEDQDSVHGFWGTSGEQDIITLETGNHFNNGKKFYEFHHILGEDQGQREVFGECNLAQLSRLFLRHGHNANVMVYGPTNSGKTFTMLGEEIQEGLSTSAVQKNVVLYQAGLRNRKTSHERPGSSMTISGKRGSNQSDLVRQLVQKYSSPVHKLARDDMKNLSPVLASHRKTQIGVYNRSGQKVTPEKQVSKKQRPSSARVERRVDVGSGELGEVDDQVPTPRLPEEVPRMTHREDGQTTSRSGVNSKDGILPRALQIILDDYANYNGGFIQQHYELRLSIIEIYNDQVSDLLADFAKTVHPRAKFQNLSIKEVSVPLAKKTSSAQTQIIVENLTEHPFSSVKEAHHILEHGLMNRKVFETVKNSSSSRSHALFQIKLYSKRQNPQADSHHRPIIGKGRGYQQPTCSSTKQRVPAFGSGSEYSQKNVYMSELDFNRLALVSQFTFVDLAGSEKLDGEHDADRINEAKFINKSLSALATVIHSLKEKHEKETLENYNELKQRLSPSPARLNTSTYSYRSGVSNTSAGRKQHIPYRDSKLTHILKNCFNQGNSSTHLIICLAPSRSSLQECVSSMKFAENAKSIQQCINESQIRQGGPLKEMRKQFESLYVAMDPSQRFSLMEKQDASRADEFSKEQAPFSTTSQRLDESSIILEGEAEEDGDIRLIENLLAEQGGSDPRQLHKALVLSLNKIKKCHLNEQYLSKKIEQLETAVLKSSKPTEDSRNMAEDVGDSSGNINTSRFGTGSILNEKNLNTSGAAPLGSSIMENSEIEMAKDMSEMMKESSQKLAFDGMVSLQNIDFIKDPLESRAAVVLDSRRETCPVRSRPSIQEVGPIQSRIETKPQSEDVLSSQTRQEEQSNDRLQEDLNHKIFAETQSCKSIDSNEELIIVNPAAGDSKQEQQFENMNGLPVQEPFMESADENPGLFKYRAGQSVVNPLNESCTIGRENYQDSQADEEEEQKQADLDFPSFDKMQYWTSQQPPRVIDQQPVLPSQAPPAKTFKFCLKLENAAAMPSPNIETVNRDCKNEQVRRQRSIFNSKTKFQSQSNSLNSSKAYSSFQQKEGSPAKQDQRLTRQPLYSVCYNSQSRSQSSSIVKPPSTAEKGEENYSPTYGEAVAVKKNTMSSIINTLGSRRPTTIANRLKLENRRGRAGPIQSTHDYQPNLESSERQSSSRAGHFRSQAQGKTSAQTRNNEPKKLFQMRSIFSSRQLSVSSQKVNNNS